MYWEYKLVDHEDYSARKFSELGKEGWELVLQDAKAYGFIFKRQALHPIGDALDITR